MTGMKVVLAEGHMSMIMELLFYRTGCSGGAKGIGLAKSVDRDFDKWEKLEENPVYQI